MERANREQGSELGEGVGAELRGEGPEQWPYGERFGEEELVRRKEDRQWRHQEGSGRES